MNPYVKSICDRLSGDERLGKAGIAGCSNKEIKAIEDAP
jgi:hypothetical protein